MNHSVNSSPHGLKLQQRASRLDMGNNLLMGTTAEMAACGGDSSWWWFLKSGQANVSGTALTSCSQMWASSLFVLPLSPVLLILKAGDYPQRQAVDGTACVRDFLAISLLSLSRLYCLEQYFLYLCFQCQGRDKLAASFKVSEIFLHFL